MLGGDKERASPRRGPPSLLPSLLRAPPCCTEKHTKTRRLLHLNRGAGLLEFLLELVGLLALDALLDRLGGLIHERLGLFQPEPGRGADDLDHLEGALLFLLGPRSLAAAGSRRRSRNRGRRYSELLLERFDPLGELEHRD